MSDTIDVGIDLGTTNSAVALARGDQVSVIKNNDGWDITPSAVWMPKPGFVYVGLPAREPMFVDPDNAHGEFKQEMGLADVRRRFEAAGVELTPQKLSAEVLKALRADITHARGGEAPDAAVITVPAAFTLNQNKATKDAAELAGFDAACQLLPEPTAAAFAYGVNNADERAYWMVFDFGGGTFDAAVVRKDEGDLRVLNHAGDPWLGGKQIDWALVERILAPAAARELGLRDFHRENHFWRRNFAVLKLAAEKAKIKLSRLDRVDSLTELKDEQGNDQTFGFSLSRDEVDTTAEPFYTRAINLCRKALSESSLGSGDIDRLLLVGGVTLSPGLRERLADPRHGLGIELDVSVDPSVVVAQGAAIYAGTVRRPRRAPARLAAGEFAVELAYEPRVTTTRPTIGGRIRAAAELPADDWTTYSVTLSNSDDKLPFRSARIPLNSNGAFFAEVAIPPDQTSKFTIELADGRGTLCKVSPDSVTITHGTGVPAAQVGHSLGIQLVDRLFAPILHKGAALPATARETFRTSGPLLRSDTDAVLRIPVVQGERSRGDRNRVVEMLEIRPADLKYDLEAGTEVEMLFMLDESNIVTVVAEVVGLRSEQLEVQINLEDLRPADPATLQQQLAEAEERFTILRGQAAESAEAQRLIAKLDAEATLPLVRDQVRVAAVDAGSAAGAEDRLRGVQADLDDIADAIQLPDLAQEAANLLAEASQLVDRMGTQADRQELALLRDKVDEAVASKNPAAVRVVRERINTFLLDLERRDPDFPIRLFYSMQQWLPASGHASALFRRGERAIAAGDGRELQVVLRDLVKLLPEDDRGKVEHGLERM